MTFEIMLILTLVPRVKLSIYCKVSKIQMETQCYIVKYMHKVTVIKGVHIHFLQNIILDLLTVNNAVHKSLCI